MNALLSFITLSALLISSHAVANRDFFKSSKHLGHQAMYQFLESSTEIEEGLKSDDLNIKSKALIACLIAWEHGDGIYGFETSSMFMEVWVSNPILMSSWFENNQTKKNRWFKSQPYIFIMLADWKGNKYAQELRDNIVKAIKSVTEPNYPQEKFFSEYIQVLNSLEIPEI